MVMYTTKPRESKELTAVSGKNVIGSNVVNLQGKNLGEIYDLAIDWEGGCVAYAILSHSSFLGMGKKLFAIPWEAFSMKNKTNFLKGADKTLVLNIPQEALKETEGFDIGNWPKEPDYDWLGKVYERYGFRPYWEKR